MKLRLMVQYERTWNICARRFAALQRHRRLHAGSSSDLGVRKVRNTQVFMISISPLFEGKGVWLKIIV